MLDTLDGLCDLVADTPEDGRPFVIGTTACAGGKTSSMLNHASERCRSTWTSREEVLPRRSMAHLHVLCKPIIGFAARWRVRIGKSLAGRGYRRIHVESLWRKRMVLRPRARGREYWTDLSKRVKASSFTEGVLKSVERYRRDKLIREQEERGRDEAPTIIPFPTEENQANDEPADTSDDA